MAKIKLKCAVVGYHFKSSRADDPIYWAVSSSYHSGKLDSETIHVQPHEFEVEVPDINLVAMKVQGLEAEKAAALEEYQEKVAAINERLSKFLALEHVEEAA